MPHSQQNVQRAKAYERKLRDATCCNRCGKQPIEWHHLNGRDSDNERVSNLVGRGRTIEAIDAEIAKCEPLCRSCHTKEHRKPSRLTCIKCRRAYKPLRKGLCNACYLRMKAYPYHSYKQDGV